MFSYKTWIETCMIVFIALYLHLSKYCIYIVIYYFVKYKEQFEIYPYSNISHTLTI